MTGVQTCALPIYDSNDESIDSDLEEGMSGMIGEDSDEERFEEVKETKKAL